MKIEISNEDGSVESHVHTCRIKIGETIKEIRENKGYNQQQLSVIMNISRSTISKIESGKFNCSIDYLSKFAYHLNFSINLIERE